MIPKIAKAYSYLVDIIELMKQGKPIPLSAINAVGGRFSGKTTNLMIVFWIVLCFLFEPSQQVFAFVGFRASVNDAMKLFNDFCAVLDGCELKYEKNATQKWIRFRGHKIEFYGINRQQVHSGRTQLSGLPHVPNVKYLFLLFEEAFEFENQFEVNSIVEAVRAFNANGEQQFQKIKIFCCNPWEEGNWYISYCKQHYEWDIEELRKNGSQAKVISIPLKEGGVVKELFHYTNWRIVREYLSQSIIDDILKTWETNPNRARVVDWGIPAYEQSAIYTHVLDRIWKRVNFKIEDELLGGGDYGWGRDNDAGMTAFVFCGYTSDVGITVYHEYTSSNKDFVKDENKLCLEVVQFYKECLIEYASKNNLNLANLQLKIRVDNAAPSFVRLLNNAVLASNLETQLLFTLCKKYNVQDRIQVVNSVAGAQQLFFNSMCDWMPVKELFKEMRSSRYKKDSQNGNQREKKNDHVLNAFEYAIEPIMRELSAIFRIDAKSGIIRDYRKHLIW